MRRIVIMGQLIILLVLAGCSDNQSKLPALPASTAVSTPHSIPISALPISEDGLDIVLQGGGAKGLAHIGAIRALEEQEQPYRRVVGTSAGSIVAVLLAAGFTADEMQAALTERMPDGNIIAGSFLIPPEAAEFDEEQLRNSITYLILQDAIPDFISGVTTEQIEMDTLVKLLERPHFREFFSLIETGGLYSGEAYMAWLRQMLNSNGRLLGDATLAEFYEATGADLTIVAADKDAGVVLMLNHRTAPELPVVWAVRMSSSIPFVFQEVAWQSEWGSYLDEDINTHLIVDGGVTTNLPLELVLSDAPEILVAMELEPNPDRVMGLVLDHDSPIPELTLTPTPSPMTVSANDAVENEQIANRWQEIRDRNIDLMDTLLNAHDHLLANTYPDQICRLPVQGVDTLEYDMSDEKVELMIAAAQSATAECLENLAD